MLRPGSVLKFRNSEGIFLDLFIVKALSDKCEECYFYESTSSIKCDMCDGDAISFRKLETIPGSEFDFSIFRPGTYFRIQGSDDVYKVVTADAEDCCSECVGHTSLKGRRINCSVLPNCVGVKFVKASLGESRFIDLLSREMLKKEET